MDINAFDVAMGAIVLPPVIAIVNQRHWPAQIKGLVALLVCAAYALIMDIIRGPVRWDDWRNVLLTTAAAAFAAYKLWWQPSLIAPSIEAATTAGGPRSGAAATTAPPTGYPPR
jgi:hypothetical protein